MRARHLRPFYFSMLNPLRKIFKGKQGPSGAKMPPGERAYVVGDIHGRADLFEELIKAIEHDDVEAGMAETTVVLLGDLVDRGPDSCGVIKLSRLWTEYRKVLFLAGNHEEMFLGAFKDKAVLRHFLKHGGRETIMSYGVSRKEFNNCSLSELQALMKERVPKSHRKFLKGFADMIEMGDYLFVHAGIKPDQPLDQQKKSDLRWIRDPFLKHKDVHSHIVVHGHTIFEEIDERSNRIGIDTGAYRHGVLTALVLEEDTRRYIQAVENKSGGIEIVKKEKVQ